MKRLALVILLLMTGTASGSEPIAAGDTELSVSGMWYDTNGDVELTAFNLQLRLGKYLTDRVLLGIGPAWTVSTIESDSELNFSAEGYIIYNFSIAKEIVPYAKGSYYQWSFDIPGNKKFTDYAYAHVGLGIRYFFNDFAAVDACATYGFALVKESHDTMVILTSGLSFIF